jgi:hypothetical protein
MQISLDPSNAIILQSAANLLKVGVWQHFALTKFGPIVTLWIDGVSAGTYVTSPVSQTFGNNSSPFQIGTWTNNTDLFQGNIDEFRVSNIARYTANFTPPSAAFVADANTLVLLHFEAVLGNLVADDAIGIVQAQQDAFPTPLGLTPALATSAGNDLVTAAFQSPASAATQYLAVDYRLGAKANNNPVSMAAQLVQGSNNQALTTQQFADAMPNFSRRLGLQFAAPDGGVWTAGKINATSLVLTPNT